MQALGSSLLNIRAMNMFFFKTMFWLCLLLRKIEGDTDESRTPHIVFVYTTEEFFAPQGGCLQNKLADYIPLSIETALFTQPDCQIILIASIHSCNKIMGQIRKIKTLATAIKNQKLEVMDPRQIMSNNTRTFSTRVKHFMGRLGMWENLYPSATARFPLLRDLMVQRDIKELMHLETDNILYPSLTGMLPDLRNYKYVACQPLTKGAYFGTASALWIGSQEGIERMVKYLYDLMDVKGKLVKEWLTDHGMKYGRRKKGGLYPNRRGEGITSHYFNEMAMIGYYAFRDPVHMQWLAPLPPSDYPPKRRPAQFDLNPWKSAGTRSAAGNHVGPPVMDVVWDPNSYGQFMGGTHRGHRGAGFLEWDHLIGYAFVKNPCKARMVCSNATRTSELGHALLHPSLPGCWTQPMVTCGKDEPGSPWYPIANLHVHSKQIQNFVPKPCACN
jgi:hypothetical protein